MIYVHAYSKYESCYIVLYKQLGLCPLTALVRCNIRVWMHNASGALV
jgi:hypothetical protein